MAGAKTKWQVKRESSYDALMTAATHCFHDHGYAATRVEDIATAAGYTTGAFYLHFANKTECFFHVLEHRERQRGEWWTLVEGRSPADTPLGTVLVEVFAHFDDVLEHTPAWTLVVVDFFQQHRGNAAVAERLRTSYGRWQDEVARFVRALQDGGWVDPGRDAADLASSLLAYVEGLTAHQVVFGMDEDRYQRVVTRGVLDLLSRH